MDRLTGRDSEGKAFLNKCYETCCGKCEECSLLDDEDEKLASYEDLEEQGLLLRLPCKIGDTVYRISSDFHLKKKYIEKTTISRIAIDEDGIYVFCACKPNAKRIFGEHVFITREEAEAKLEETEG